MSENKTSKKKLNIIKMSSDVNLAIDKYIRDNEIKWGSKYGIKPSSDDFTPELRLDVGFTIKSELKGEKPKIRLTKREIKLIESEVLISCIHAFCHKFRNDGLVNLNYELTDIVSEAYKHFLSITKTFDKTKYKNIGVKYVEGARQPKTLGWYFLNYYQKAVNYIAKDNSVKRNQKRGIFTKQEREMRNNPFKKHHYESFSSDFDISQFSATSEQKHKSELLDILQSELKKQPRELTQFFIDRYSSFLPKKNGKEYSIRQLKRKYGKRYNKLYKKLRKFILDFKSKHSDDLMLEFDKGFS